MSSADVERTILNHYNIKSTFPSEWPTELDQSEEEDEEPSVGVRRSRSRYSALERAASDRRTLLPGSQQTRDGRANLVQKDEPDPLGTSSSVMQTLRKRGVPIEQDGKTRDKYMLSSTTFQPALFLSKAHSDASTDDLIHGLQHLSSSIDQKSASLKVLVETNFERFVRAKATIDNVYTEMRNQGIDEATLVAQRPTSPTPRGLRHSRQVSRQGFHQRITSGGNLTPTPTPIPAPTPSKNALRKETEYGVQGVKDPLLEVSQRAEDVWGPALGGKEREAGLKAIVEAIEQDRSLYELGGVLSIAIQQKNYEKVVELYSSARGYAYQAMALSDKTSQTGQTLSDEQIHKILVTGRMWADVQDQIKGVKRDIWRRLTNVSSAPVQITNTQDDEHMELIGVLLELGVNDNPIWVWLFSRYDHLKSKINAVADRSKVEIEILRRRLASADAPSAIVAASYIRSAVKDPPDFLDNDNTVEFWQILLVYVTKLLSSSTGLLGEVVDFWDTAKSFIEGNRQKALPVGYEGESRKHHRLSESGVRDLRNGIVELVTLIRDALHALFADAPTEDISSIISPTPDSARGATPRTPVSTFSPSEGRLGNIDESNIPKPSPRKGEGWEDFAFWPPYSNTMSAVNYLNQILNLVARGASEMAALAPVNSSSATSDKLKGLVNTARERSLKAICVAWGKDAENCKALEDWLRSLEKRNQTRLPSNFSAFEKTIITGVQQILYFSDATSKSNSKDIIMPPPSKLLQTVRTSFVDSIYKALSGMMENAEAPVKSNEDEWILSSEAMKHSAVEGQLEVASYSIDASNRNIRMLMTLSNLKALRNEHVPQLIQLFESSFTVKLTEESKRINDLFGEVDTRLFHSYTRPTITYLTRTIKDGINLPTWEPATTRPEQVSPYVYKSLMVLVMVHTEVSTTVTNAGTSNSGLLNEILSYLLESVTQALLDGFKERQPNRYTLAALIQATLDTEFVAQTMSQYASKKVNDIQNEIYVELDKRTTNEARVDLQKELGVMRGVLKKLRENSRNSFGCFKRQKSSEKDRNRAER